jgi:hypothetical protein
MFLKLLERLGRKRIIYDRVNNEPYLVTVLSLFERKKPFSI